MDLLNNILELLQYESVQEHLPRIGGFAVFFLLSLLFGRYVPWIVAAIVHRFSPTHVSTVYNNLLNPLENLFRTTSTLVLVSLSFNWLREYGAFYDFFRPFLTLAVIVSIAWFISRIFKQFIRVYGISLLRRVGGGVDELISVLETTANVLIGLIAALAFAQSQQFNLIGLLASLGIGGLAVAFAAQKILEQLLSTVVLYLDRPFVPGDYIRLSDNQLGRVEAIGLRSTKVRTSGKSTLMVVPNSELITTRIENVTRAKKVMVLLYMDFSRPLEDQDCALVCQVIKGSTDALFGIDPGSTRIALLRNPKGFVTRARVTFFILGSSENSIELRKRLLELANEKISKELSDFGVQFTLQEPTSYVESPVTV